MRWLGSLLLFFIAQSSFAMITVHVSREVLSKKMDCASYMEASIKNALTQLGDETSVVFLGEYKELEERLVKAGVTRTRAKSATDDLREIHALAYQFPAFEFTAAVFDDLVTSNKLFVCPVSVRCKFAQANFNSIAFTDQHECILIIPP